MISADWIIDLGPGGGGEGGRLVAEGTPEEVAKSQTPTGQVLKRELVAAGNAG
jgi:excinuclease ABC subunit A